MKVPQRQRQRVHLKSFDKTWRRVRVSVALSVLRLEMTVHRLAIAEIAIAQIAANMDITVTDNGNGTYSHTFTPRKTDK